MQPTLYLIWQIFFAIGQRNCTSTIHVAQNSEAGKINFCTYERVKKKFKCPHPGKFQLKNNVKTDRYFMDAVSSLIRQYQMYIFMGLMRTDTRKSMHTGNLSLACRLVLNEVFPMENRIGRRLY